MTYSNFHFFKLEEINSSDESHLTSYHIKSINNWNLHLFLYIISPLNEGLFLF